MAITSSPNPTLWAQQLRIILLILRTSINTSVEVSPAKALYGQELRLPGNVFTPNPSKTPTEISDRIVQAMESLKNKVTHHDTKRIYYLPPALSKCSHVFVRDDRVKKPFTAPYFGPFKILDRNDKHYTLDMRSKPTPISIDQLKPCYIFYESQPMSTSQTQQYTPQDFCRFFFKFRTV